MVFYLESIFFLKYDSLNNCFGHSIGLLKSSTVLLNRVLNEQRNVSDDKNLDDTRYAHEQLVKAVLLVEI